MKLVKWKPQIVPKLQMNENRKNVDTPVRSVRQRRPSTQSSVKYYAAEEEKELEIYVDMNTTVNSIDHSYLLEKRLRDIKAKKSKPETRVNSGKSEKTVTTTTAKSSA